MKRTLLSLCCFLIVASALCAQSDDERSAAQLAEDYVKLRDPARVDDLKRFLLTEAVPAYYKLRRRAIVTFEPGKLILNPLPDPVDAPASTQRA